MEFDRSLLETPDCEDAIDEEPLIVEPQMRVTEVIERMSQARAQSCLLEGDATEGTDLLQFQRGSCALVMQGRVPLGIFTERDLVRLAATQLSLEGLAIAEVMTHPVITLPLSMFRDIFAALFLFRRYHIRHLPIVDDQGELVGLVSSESIRRILRPANLLKLRRVADVMTTTVVQVPVRASILQVAQLMDHFRVSCVVITAAQEEAGQIVNPPAETEAPPNPEEEFLYPVGIITERDMVQFQALQLDFSRVTAEAVMSTPLFLLSPEDSLWKAHQEMQQRRIRRLVVSWNWGRNLGLVTQTSLLRIFDPVEMYGVLETLQRTLEYLQVAKPTLSAQPWSESFEGTAQPLTVPPVASTPTPTEICHTLLSTVQATLENVLEQTDECQEAQKHYWQLALNNVQQAVSWMQQSQSLTPPMVRSLPK